MLAFFCCALTLVLLYFGSPKEVKAKLVKQSEIFKDHHTWWQTYLYIMTFGCCLPEFFELQRKLCQCK